jgi:lactate dehydrogenase-like 2-hydroxyacid dehydrogenase
MYRVLVVDRLESSYLEGLAIERDVLGSEAILELCRVPDESQIDDRLERADLVISWHGIALTAHSFGRMRNCRGVVRAAVGYDNIDIAAARKKGISVANVPDYGTEEVADHALCLLLYILRNLTVIEQSCRTGQWDWRVVGKVKRLRGMRLGLIGFGRIGMAVAARARAFGMQVMFHDPFVPSGLEKSLSVERVESLQELLRSCAAVSLHVPSTPQTRMMIGRRELEAMPSDAILINTARGDVVDQPALIAHLLSHPEFRAGLDVVADEPRVPAELRHSRQVVLSAHSAFYADESMIELRRKVAETASRLYRGEPVRTIVN